MATPVGISITLNEDGLLYSALDRVLSQFEKNRKLNLNISEDFQKKIETQIREAEKIPFNINVRIDKKQLETQLRTALKDIGAIAGNNAGNKSNNSTQSTRKKNTSDARYLRQSQKIVNDLESGRLTGVGNNARLLPQTSEVKAYSMELEKIRGIYSGLSEQAKTGVFTNDQDIVRLNQLKESLSKLDPFANAARWSVGHINADNTADKVGNKLFDYKNRFGDIIKQNSKNSYNELLNFENRFLDAQNQGFPKSDIKEYSAELDALIEKFGKLGVIKETAAQKAAKGISTVAQYATMMKVWNGTIQLFKAVISNTKEIETRLAQVRIVTGASVSEIHSFAKEAAEASKIVGSTVSDILRSSETWARLGYSLSDSLNLAEVTAAFGNVADTTVEQGTESMTSILKAYGFAPSQLEYVSDVLVNIGAKYAVSAEEIGIAMQAAGAALEAGNNSFEESVAMIASANAAVQDASTVGNALKTSSLRIRGSKAELEDMGEEVDDLCESSSKLRAEIKALTKGKVDIMLGDGKTYKSMYQIILDIAEVWDSLSDISQATLLEDLAGKRNASVIKSMITNIKDLKGAYADAFTSGGTTMEANAIALDTIDGKMKQLSATFQNWSSNLGVQHIIKPLITLLTDFLELGNGAIAEFVAITAAINIFGVAVKGIKKSGLIITVFSEMATTAKKASTAIIGLGKSLSGLVVAHPIIAAITAIIIALAAAIQYATSKGERFQGQLESYNQQKDELESLNTQLDDNNKKIAEIQSKGELSLTDKADIENLKRQNTELEAQKNIQQELLNIEKEKLKIKMENGDYKETGKWSFRRGGLEYIDFDIAVGWLSGKNSKYISEEHKQQGKEFIANQLTEDLKTIQDYDILTKDAQKVIGQRINQAYTALKYGKNEIANKAFSLAGGISEFSDIVTDLKENKISLGDLINEKDANSAYNNFLNFISLITGAKIPETLSSDYEEIKKEAEKLGVDLNKTVYGNIDTDNRMALEWNDDNLRLYKDELEAWGFAIDELKGSISTVLGMSEEFDGVEIAFSPILQTNSGPVLLSPETVRKYIEYLISQLGEDWTTEDLIKQDATHLTLVDGHAIRGLIADVGDTAIKTGQAMHYTGKTGAVNGTKKGLSDLETIFNDFTETGNAAEEAEKKVKSFKEQLKTLSETEGELNKIPDMLRDFKDGDILGTEELQNIAETFAGVSGLEESLKVLASPDLSCEELRVQLGLLTSELILNKIASGELSAENETLIAKMLKAAGVSNSTAAAHELCAIAKEKERLATYDFSNMTAEEIMQLYNEKGATDATKLAILDLIKQKISAMRNNISTSTDVAELMKLAQAAGVAQAEIATLAKAKSYFDMANSYRKDAKSGGRNANENNAFADMYEKMGNDVVSNGINALMEQINGELTKNTNFISSYTPTQTKEKEKSEKKDEPDYEDTTDAIIRYISAKEREHEKNVEALEDKLALIDVEKEYADAIAVTEAKERENAKRRIALLDKQRQLTEQADYVRNSSRYNNTESWFDPDGELTVAYYNLFNSLDTKTAQDNLKSVAEALQKYKKEYISTDEEIQKIDESILSDEKAIWDYRKKIAEEYAQDADEYIEHQENIGWTNRDSKLSALSRKIKHITEESYKRLFKDEEEYSEFVLENIEKYREALQDRIDTTKDNLDRYVSKIKESYDEQIEKKENLITKQKALYEIQEAEYSSLNKISDIYRDIDKQLAASKIATAYLTDEERKQVFNEDDYEIISDKLKATNADIAALTQNFNESIARAYKDNNLYLVESMTEEYKRQLSMKERELEITQKQVDLQKKQDALNNILNEKNIRQIVEKNGKLQYEWTYDTDKARQAAEDLADIQADIGRANTEYGQQAVLNGQQGYINMLSNQKSALEKTVDLISTAVENISTAIDELKNPIKTVNSLIVSFGEIGIVELNKSMNDFLDVLSSATGKTYVKLPTSTTYDKAYDYMKDIEAELAKGANADWGKIAEANTVRNAKIQGEKLEDLPWQGISSKSDDLGEILLTDSDGGKLTLVPTNDNLTIRNFTGWDNPNQSNIFGIKPSQVGANIIDQNTGKTVNNTVGDIIIQHVANFNDFIKQVKERVSTMGALLE